MKRPQGFDRPPQAPPVQSRSSVPRSPSPSGPAKSVPTQSGAPEPEATIRDAPVQSDADTTPSGTPPNRPARGTPWWLKTSSPARTEVDDRAVTEPIPLIPPSSRAAAAEPDADRAERDHPRVGDQGSARGSERTADRSPSNREVRAALRQARRERARVERGEVRRFTKRSRQRRMVWFTALGTVGLLVVGVTLTAFSPLLAVRAIDVEGTSRIKATQVVAALKGQLGKPLALVDFAAVKSDLAAFPLIRSFSTESQPPGTLVVRIVERVPIGLLAEGKTFRLVDAAKVTISSSATRPAGFPIIVATGATGATGAESGFAAAAAVLQALPPSVLSGVDTITAQTKDDVRFTLLGSGATVIWGSADQSDLKAADLAAIMKSAGADSASVFDVSSPHTVVRR